MKLLTNNVWDFIEKNHPNYYKSRDIANVLDMEKILSKDFKEGDSAYTLFQKMKEDVRISHMELGIDLFQIPKSTIEKITLSNIRQTLLYTYIKIMSEAMENT